MDAVKGLVKYNEARRALQAAAKVDEAEALRVYARQANDADLETWAAELSRELDKAHKAGQGRTVQFPTTGKLKAQVLKEAGLTLSTAHRCEQLAAVPEAQFEAYITKRKEARCGMLWSVVEGSTK